MATKVPNARKKPPKGRATIKKELTAQLTRAGRLNAVTKDLLAQYLDARDRMLTAKDEWNRLNEMETADGMIPDASWAEVIRRETETMERLLRMMGAAPETERRRALEDEIREQLAAKGLNRAVFQDQAERFLNLWDAFQEANRSLNERGRSYITISSSGKEYEKDNAAVKDIVALARAMQDELRALDITVEGYMEPDDDEL